MYVVLLFNYLYWYSHNIVQISFKYSTETNLNVDLPSKRAKNPTEVTRDDIVDLQTYSKQRRTVYYPIRRDIKKVRLLHIGPFSTVTFENYDLMWMQIHEMLYIEKGGEEQIEDELAAYNPMIPKGSNFPITFMIEIDDPVRRNNVLRTLGGIENTIKLQFKNYQIEAENVDGQKRTTDDGRTSAVHFLNFKLSPIEKEEFLKLTEDDEVRLTISHKNYNHSTGLPWNLVNSLKEDLK